MKSRLFPALLALASLSGCRFPAIAPQTPAEVFRPGTSQAAPALRGSVSFGPRAQAAVGDLIEAATVSLIDAASGRTVSTARTDAAGQFVLTFENGFTADPAATYYLETLKGLSNNQPGHPAVRLRTIVRYADGWTSITNSAPNAGIVVNAATTALSIGAGTLPGFDPRMLIGKLNGTTYTPVGALSDSDYQAILALVSEILASDKDPMHHVGHSESKGWTGLEQPLTVNGGQVEVARGETITLSGTFHPETDAQSVTFEGIPAKVLAATSTTLSVQVPPIPWYSTGRITVRRGQAQVLGPEYTNEPTTVTLAGTGASGSTGDGGPATSATFAGLMGVAADASGSIYLADQVANRIRKVTPEGTITTFAGGGAGSGPGPYGNGGAATSASLSFPNGVAADASGNVYIADSQHHHIRKVSPDGLITTVAGTTQGDGGDGGLATAASFTSPQGVVVDEAGKLYVASTLNYRVRVVGLDGIITAFAGKNSTTYSGSYGPNGDGGPAVEATIRHPRGMAVDRSGNVFIADDSGRVRRVSPGGIITTVAGGGSSFAEGIFAKEANLPRATGVALDPAGNLYVAFTTQDGVGVRQVGTDGRIRTVYQTGAQPQTAGDSAIRVGIGVDPLGRLLIADPRKLQVIRLE